MLTVSNMRKLPILSSSILLLSSLQLVGQESIQEVATPVQVLDDYVVTASRFEDPLANAPNTVEVLTQEELDQLQIRSCHCRTVRSQRFQQALNRSPAVFVKHNTVRPGIVAENQAHKLADSLRLFFVHLHYRLVIYVIDLSSRLSTLA